MNQLTTVLHKWQGIIKGPWKTKAIQIDLSIWHNVAYSGIFRNVCNSGMFKTLVYSEQDAYSELGYIQNRHKFRA